MSRTKLDALSVFTILFAQCLTLQVAKDVQSHALTSWRILPTLALALAIVRAHLAPTSDHALVALAASGAVVLCVNGSQSNHVLLELAVAGAVLLCAPASLPVSPSSSPRTTRLKVGAPSRPESPSPCASRSASSTSPRASRNSTTTGTIPPVSCCVQMLVGALAGLGLSPSAVAAAAPAPLRAAAPTPPPRSNSASPSSSSSRVRRELSRRFVSSPSPARSSTCSSRFPRRPCPSTRSP